MEFVSIDGNSCTALLDTGSTVSTISEKFYSDYVSEFDIYPRWYYRVCLINQGFVCFLLCLTVLTTMVLPVLLGTNILTPALEECRHKYGERLLHVACLHTPWYLAFRSIVLQDKGLSKSNGRLGLVRSAMRNNLTLRLNSTMVIPGYFDKKIPFRDACTMMVATASEVILI